MSNFPDYIHQELLAKFSNSNYEIDQYQEHNVTIDASVIHELIEWLKSKGFNFLTDLTGNHFPEQTGAEFQVIYHLHHLIENFRIRLKVNLSAVSPEIPTITDLFSAANWMERETFDFFGIIFKGHPNLSRILNMDDMDYHPMRKEYALEDETRQDKQDSFFGR